VDYFGRSLFLQTPEKEIEAFCAFRRDKAGERPLKQIDSRGEKDGG
jgi:hypothetical protein